MLSLIPIDVWIAAVLAGAVVLLAFFGPSTWAFAAIYVGVCAYLVLNNFGGLGRAYVETDEAEVDQATIVNNILSGQYSSPLRVIAFNAGEGWARDVTEDIAHAVLDRARIEHPQSLTAHRSFWKGAESFCIRGRLISRESSHAMWRPPKEPRPQPGA